MPGDGTAGTLLSKAVTGTWGISMKLILFPPVYPLQDEAIDPGEATNPEQAINPEQVNVQAGDPQDNDLEETYLGAKEDADYEAEEGEHRGVDNSVTAEECDDVSFLKAPEIVFADGSIVTVAKAQA
ncbi:hypothetical protein EC957_001391 [Mortierella hygrophila]|uniref:Uncharacterized protein n=1 Tax=Mortierella hygrophila TaxID=979708 RepID=A0A9P6K1V3_9FUNG|nr:hypothetical protein EC957_001391 [Mortierella hygrophila]